MKKILQYLSAYVLLSLILLLGLWLFLLGRETVTGLLRAYFVGDSFSRSYQVGFFDRMLTLFLGLGWIILFVVAEEFVRRHITKGGLPRIISRFLGIECMIAAVLDSIMLLFLTGINAVSWFRVAILVIEFAAGILLIFLGWSRRSPWYQRKKTGVIQGPPIVSDKSTQP